MKYNAPYGAANPNAPYINGNPATGTAGSIPPAESIEHPQREIVQVISDADMAPSKDDLSQLSKAVKKLAQNAVTGYTSPLTQLSCLPWVPVMSMTLKTPPNSPSKGDMYFIPDGANGAWSSKTNQIAEWNGEEWLFTNAKDGHGIGLPDGQIWQKINNSYEPNVARSVQSGQWNYAEASGSADAITIMLNPPPLRYYDGMVVVVTPKATTETDKPTINVNGLGKRAIINPDGSNLRKNTLKKQTKVALIYDELKSAFVVITGSRQAEQIIGFSVSGTAGDSLADKVINMKKSFTTKHFDTDNQFDMKTGIYTCPVSGYFTVNGYYWFNDIANIVKIYLIKNNNTFNEISMNARGRVLSTTATVDVVEGDMLQMGLVQESGGTMYTPPQGRASCGFTGLFAGI